MSYAVIITPDPAAVLTRLSWRIAHRATTQLQVLAADPVSLSRPVALSGSSAGQGYYFDFEDGGISYAFYVVFQYSADEQSLHILQITVDEEPLES